MVVAEVGTYDGNTTCLALPVVESCNGKYIAIDWFKGTKNPNWKNIDHPHYYDPSQAEDTSKDLSTISRPEAGKIFVVLSKGTQSTQLL